MKCEACTMKDIERVSDRSAHLTGSTLLVRAVGCMVMKALAALSPLRNVWCKLTFAAVAVLACRNGEDS